MKRSEFMLTATASAIPVPSGPALGKTAFPAFASAPFPHPSRSAGHEYGGKHFDARAHYADDTVGVFVPARFHAGRTFDVVVHFHGWNNDVRTVFERYRLREQLVASARNAVLLVPQGPRDAPDSGDGKLELDDGGFRRFLDEATAWLRASRLIADAAVRRVVITAHSGGYGGSGGALLRGGASANVTDVLLFDAAYGYFDAFAAWVNASRDNHLLSVFTDDTSMGNATLMAMVQQAQPNLYVRLADAMTLEQLQTRAPTFALTATVAHDDLLQSRAWYELFLRTTALDSLDSG